MQQLITERMVEMTFAPATDIAKWFTRLGLEAHTRSRERRGCPQQSPHGFHHRHL